MLKLEHINKNLMALKRPAMNSPSDQYLSEIRQSLELDNDLIAGVLSYLNKGKRPHFYEQLLVLPTSLISVHSQLEQYIAEGQEDKRYLEQLLKYVRDLLHLTQDIKAYCADQNISDSFS
jgi:hypothetical protein